MAAGQTKKQFSFEAQDQYSRPGYRPNGESVAGNEIGPNTKQFLNVLSRLESDTAWKAALASVH